jgi:lycopene beta-cyclase
MPYWLFDVVALLLPTALLLSARPAPGRLWAAGGGLAVVALAWTAPWDEHLVRTGVWSYGPERVLVAVGSVPVEEYGFVVLLVALVAAWGSVIGRLPARPSRPAGRSRPAVGRGRAAGAAGWLAVVGVGAALLAAGGSWRYLGLLLVWVGSLLALQHAVAGDLLRPRAGDRLVVALPVVLWLCLADRLALGDGIWAISPASSTGWSLLGLPVEEALFFALVVHMVTDGLLLATDAEALRRARRCLPGVRPRRVRSSV